MFDEAKSKRAQMKKIRWWPVNSAARFSVISEIDNTILLVCITVKYSVSCDAKYSFSHFQNCSFA